MAKVQIKSEKLTPFGGIFSIMEQFDALLAQTIEIAVEDTFFYSNHLLSLPSCHFSFYLCEKAAWYGPLFWINNFRKSGISRILPAIRAVRF